MIIQILLAHLPLMYHMLSDRDIKKKGDQDKKMDIKIAAALSFVISVIFAFIASDALHLPFWIEGLRTGLLCFTSHFMWFDMYAARRLGKRWSFFGTTAKTDKKFKHYNKWLVLSFRILLYVVSFLTFLL